MTDLPTRLRAMAGQIPGTEDCYEAADYIERLEAALRPFAEVADDYIDEAPGTHLVTEYLVRFRKARAALENKNV